LIVITPTEVIGKLKKGEREFSEIRANGQDFTRMNLNKIVFSNSKFIACKFTAANLQNAKFENCSFEFCEFTDANLIESNFTNCKIQYTVFQSANMERAVFTGCELYFIYVWGSNFNSAVKFEKTQMAKIFSVLSQASEEDVKEALRALSSSSTPLGFRSEIKGRFGAAKEKYEGFLRFAYGKGTKDKGMYGIAPNVYSKTQSDEPKVYVTENPFYTLFTAYLAKQQYGKKNKE